jgi:hypothetical protein
VEVRFVREVRIIHRLEKRARSEGKRYIKTIVEIGKWLERVKARVGHGKFMPWVDKNFEFSVQTAENYIGLYQLAQRSKSKALLNLNLPAEALYVLARRNVPEPARIAVVKRVEAGEKLTASSVRAIVAPYKQPLEGRGVVRGFSDDGVAVRGDRAQEHTAAKALPAPIKPTSDLITARDVETLEEYVVCIQEAIERSLISAKLAPRLEWLGQALLDCAHRMRRIGAKASR